MKYHDKYSFVVADIPGIIQGASEGKGLGLRFLRHIERNSVLLFMISVESENIKKEYKILLQELKNYNPELLDKKRMLAISKCDIISPDELDKIKKKTPSDIPVVFLSSHIQMGVSETKDLLWKLLTEAD